MNCSAGLWFLGFLAGAAVLVLALLFVLSKGGK